MCVGSSSLKRSRVGSATPSPNANTSRVPSDGTKPISEPAASDTAGSLIGFVPSLGTREVFAFGEGVALPTRLRFKELDAQHIPHSHAITRANMDSARNADVGFLLAVVERWRGATMSNQARTRPVNSGDTDDLAELDMMAGSEFSRLRPDAPLLAPVAPGAAPSIRKSATNPETFFFPVDDGKPRLRR